MAARGVALLSWGARRSGRHEEGPTDRAGRGGGESLCVRGDSGVDGTGTARGRTESRPRVRGMFGTDSRGRRESLRDGGAGSAARSQAALGVAVQVSHTLTCSRTTRTIARFSITVLS